MTSKRQPKAKLPHGTLGGYTNHKCRCDKCLEAHRDYQREYMARNEHQRRLATLRERMRYWRNQIEFRSLRHKYGIRAPEGMRVSDAKDRLAHYEAMYAETRDAGIDETVT